MESTWGTKSFFLFPHMNPMAPNPRLGMPIVSPHFDEWYYGQWNLGCSAAILARERLPEHLAEGILAFNLRLSRLPTVGDCKVISTIY